MCTGFSCAVLPPGIGLAVARIGPRAAAPDYRETVARFSERRRQEFLAGRQAAAVALRRVGAATGRVGRDQAGLPCWPAGWSGSISHDRARAVAVAASSAWRLGIDLEDLTRPAAAEAADALCLNAKERHSFQGTAGILTAFSLKEAVFKANADTAGVRFWLPDVTLEQITPGLCRWSIRGAGLTGRVQFWHLGRSVLSLCCGLRPD